MPITYSVIIPLKNEEGNIQELINEIEPVMAGMKSPWELICIDDGSTDNTLTILSKLSISKPYMRIISFDRNHGQSSAFDAGFRNAKGEWVISLDGDRQNDPADIPNMIAAADGYDLVCGYRFNRRDPWHKKLTSRIANFIRGRLCQDEIRDTGCSLKVYRAHCLRKIKMYQGMHRFLPALFMIEGYRVCEVPVNHRERMRGKTNYTFFNRSFNTIADMLAVRWMRKRRLEYRIEKEIP